LKYKILLIYK